MTDQRVADVLAAWNAVYPVQLRMEPEALRAFIDRGEGSVQYVVTDDQDQLEGWGLCFDRDGERWFSLLVPKAWQGQGIGKAIIQAMQTDEDELSGWVIDHDRDRLSSGEPYRSPLAFYLRLGFTVLSDIRWEDEQISAVRIQWKRPASRLPL